MTHPTDALRLVPFETVEAQAEAWSDRVEIQHMVDVTSAVFAKWASPELLSRFRQQMMAVIQQAYIEGASEAAPASPLPEGGEKGVYAILELSEQIARANEDRNSTVTIQKWAAEKLLGMVQ